MKPRSGGCACATAGESSKSSRPRPGRNSWHSRSQRSPALTEPKGFRRSSPPAHECPSGARREGIEPHHCRHARLGGRSNGLGSAKILPMLRLVLPKGSLEKATFQLFSDAALAVTRSSDVNYRASIADPRIDDVRILRPQEIPVYVADGLFDLGITGQDWIEERGSDVVSLGELNYAKATSTTVRIVLAVAQQSPVTSMADLAG